MIVKTLSFTALIQKGFVLILILMFVIVASCKEDDEQPINKQPTFYDNPEDASIITSDIALFWQIYDASSNTFEPTAFKSDYFDAGTTALRLFFESKIKNVTKLTSNLNNVGINDYYKAIRSNTENLNDISTELLNGFKTLKTKYPDAVFSDVVFVIGALSTGGTVVKNGQMVIGTEMFSKDDDTPLNALNYWQKQVVRDRSFLSSIVIHELMHVQQARHNLDGSGLLSKNTLLDRAVNEGVADFVTFLVLGNFFNDFIHDFANPIEQTLWEEFKVDMEGTDISAWLYNAGSATADRPGDLGYYVGFKMAEYFYQKQSNKDDALKTLLELDSGDQLLILSEYDKKFD